MAFEIYLPASRLEASRGLWLDRLPVDFLDAARRASPERAAFVGRNSAQGREIRLTYAELGARVDAIAIGLLECGVGKGDVVAFQLPNWWEFTALFFACNRIGAVANPLMPIFRQRELRFMLGFAEAKVVVVPALWRGFDHLAMLREIRGRRGRQFVREGTSRPPTAVRCRAAASCRSAPAAQRGGGADLHLGHFG
jgi:cyclohexanecarboxylate-CoA ligase